MGSSEDDDNDDDGNVVTNTSDDDNDDDDNSDHDHEDEHDSLPVRDPGNGVLAFHAGTELALLHHVQTELEVDLFMSKKKKKHDDGTSNKSTQVVQTSPPPPPPAIATAQLVLDRIDTFCSKRHWMMHIGPEKGKHIQAFIVKCLQSHEQKRNKNNKELSFVELGTYCGYSSIFIAKTILEYQYEQHQKEEKEEDTHGEINDEMTAEEESSATVLGIATVFSIQS